MKKSFFLISLIALMMLTSCRVTKTITMINAKSNAAETEVEFIKHKITSISFLPLSEEQEEIAIGIWKKEKEQLEKNRLKKNSDIALVIFQSENQFRSILTPEQLKEYKAEYNDSMITKYFLSNRAMNEIKRIYKLEGEIR
ncbi:hypothetical protein [Flavobacterium lindanitolerans]|nr:hypothetical protein [Flavobacterium lindanitolerans]MBC8644533.1 hypothetical protein [Flavobacterium lindanitolerans]